MIVKVKRICNLVTRPGQHSWCKKCFLLFQPIYEHEMPNISFASGGDTDTLDYVAYVAKDKRCFWNYKGVPR